MTRERVREEFEKWLSKRSMQLFPTEPCLKTDISGRSSEVDLAIQIRAKAEKLAREALAAGERLGREREREECARLADQYEKPSELAEANRARGVAQEGSSNENSHMGGHGKRG